MFRQLFRRTCPARSYHPKLETLEQRLPPGDALGGLLAWLELVPDTADLCGDAPSLLRCKDDDISTQATLPAVVLRRPGAGREVRAIELASPPTDTTASGLIQSSTPPVRPAALATSPSATGTFTTTIAAAPFSA